jgi:hypothetical protein
MKKKRSKPISVDIDTKQDIGYLSKFFSRDIILDRDLIDDLHYKIKQELKAWEKIQDIRDLNPQESIQIFFSSTILDHLHNEAWQIYSEKEPKQTMPVFDVEVDSAKGVLEAHLELARLLDDRTARITFLQTFKLIIDALRMTNQTMLKKGIRKDQQDIKRKQDAQKPRQSKKQIKWHERIIELYRAERVSSQRNKVKRTYKKAQKEGITYAESTIKKIIKGLK